MTGDRHADALYDRLLAGGSPTADEARHAESCRACARAIALAGSLDGRLRSAAAPLAEEPLPDAVLEIGPVDVGAPVAWAPAALAAAAILLAAVGIGLAGRPVAAPEPSVTSSASPSPAPTERPTPDASPDGETAHLVAGGRACHDGLAGFSVTVPEGWFATRRLGDEPACRVIAPRPVDASAPLADVADAILVAEGTGDWPAGTIVERATSRTDGGLPVERFVVERGGVRHHVAVVRLRGGERSLRLATAVDRPDTVAALDAVVASLVEQDAPVADAEAAAAVAALFAEPDVCLSVEDGLLVVYPDAWWTNTAAGALPACRHLHPTHFSVLPDGSVPDGSAVTIALPADAARPDGTLRRADSIVVGGRPAEVLEGDEGLEIVLELGPEHGGADLTVSVDDAHDPIVRAVALEIARRMLIAAPAPDEVVGRTPLPSCGEELVELTLRSTDPDAARCLLDAHLAGEPAELVSVRRTVEGAPIRLLLRSLPGGPIEVYEDASEDPYGSYDWMHQRCAGVEPQGLLDAQLLVPVGCGDAEVLRERRRP